MPWIILEKDQAASWNEKLKTTKAPFSQYPYYTVAINNFRLSKVIFLVFRQDEKEIAYCAITEIGMYPFKVGILEGGPVPLEDNVDRQLLIEELKAFAYRRNYPYLQVRPFDKEQEAYFSKDPDFQQKLFFPFHQQEENEYNIYNKPEPELLAGLKGQCRRKIVLAGRMPYQFVKLEKGTELKPVFNLFRNAARKKHYHFIPYQAFRDLFFKGKDCGLCDIYVTYLNNELINAVLIVKDAFSYYHMSSAMEVKGFKESESPSAKLHYFLMQDCFLNEKKDFYNISYGGSDNLLRFKDLFNPTLIMKPFYYTFVINSRMVRLLEKVSPRHTSFLRSTFKKGVDLVSGLFK